MNVWLPYYSGNTDPWKSQDGKLSSQSRIIARTAFYSIQISFGSWQVTWLPPSLCIRQSENTQFDVSALRSNHAHKWINDILSSRWFEYHFATLRNSFRGNMANQVTITFKDIYIFWRTVGYEVILTRIGFGLVDCDCFLWRLND